MDVLWDKMAHLHAISVCHIDPETSMSTLCLDRQVHIWKSIQIMPWLILSLWNQACLQNWNISMSTVKHGNGQWRVSLYEVVWPIRVADHLTSAVSPCSDGNRKPSSSDSFLYTLPHFTNGNSAYVTATLKGPTIFAHSGKGPMLMIQGSVVDDCQTSAMDDGIIFQPNPSSESQTSTCIQLHADAVVTMLTTLWYQRTVII